MTKKTEENIEIPRDSEEKSLDPKMHRLRIILLAIFITVAAVTASIALVSYFSTNVYQNHEEFSQYVDDESKFQQIFTVTGKTKNTYNYDRPVSYAVDYDTVSNENISAFRDEKIKELESAFKQEKDIEEQERAVKNKEKGKHKPLAHALIVNSASFDSDNGAVSVGVYSSDNEEKDKDMVKKSSNIDTYLFSKETGRIISPFQALKEDYKSKCADYFTEYFLKTYSKEDLKEGWEKYMSAEEGNFNKFLMGEKDITFYFDEGTVLKKSKGVISVSVPNIVLADVIRSEILRRYIDPAKPMVAITYDDGPGGDSETRILDCLEQNGCVATFFYYGSKISNNPGQIKRAAQIGCEIGNHTWSHPRLTTLTKEKIAAEISKTNEAIKSACSSYPTVFRPSYGITDSTVNSMVGLPVIMWSIDTLDWKTRDANKTFEAVSKNSSLDGKIILMHSIHEPTAVATELIVPWLIDNGYQTVTVSELIRYKNGQLPVNGQVYR